MRKLLYISLLFTLLIFGCRDKKIPQVPKSREILRGVLDTSGERLKTGKQGGTLIRAEIPELDTFNVVTTRSRPVYAMLKLIFEPLLSIHPITGEIQGGIAKEYRIERDGYSITLLLNENIRFSDGNQCTSEDVIFSFEEVYMNPDVDSKKTDFLRIRNRAVSIKALDELTVQFDLPVPYRPFLYTLTQLEILPEHILSPLMKQEGVEAFNRKWGNPDNDISLLLGTGPYMLKEYRKADRVVLTRNPYYNEREGGLWLEGMPYFDKIVELIGVDHETKLLKFQIGEIDFYNIRPTDIVSGDIGSLIRNKKEGNYELYHAGHTPLSNHFLVLNQNPATVQSEKLKLFRNSRFREAVSYLINKELIRDEVFSGYAFLDASPLRDSSPYYKHVTPLQYDPARAKQILRELGIKDIDNDGLLNLPSGENLELTLYTNQDNPIRIRMGDIISESFKQIGIGVDFQPIDYDLVVTKLLDTFDWEAVIIGIEGNTEPNDSSWVWESKGPLHMWAPYQEKPLTEWEEKIDELFALGRITWDIESARGLYHEFQDIAGTERPVINIVVPAEVYGFRNGLGNLIPRAVSYNATALLPYIYWEKKH
ncbi:MAG: ABC transporter substrate-binding protein [Spirochaetota bacterium]|nr:MAG: ABC transporter substrate-binding protein [Spirochaetota bacterium]